MVPVALLLNGDQPEEGAWYLSCRRCSKKVSFLFPSIPTPAFSPLPNCGALAPRIGMGPGSPLLMVLCGLQPQKGAALPTHHAIKAGHLPEKKWNSSRKHGEGRESRTCPISLEKRLLCKGTATMSSLWAARALKALHPFSDCHPTAAHPTNTMGLASPSP